MRHSVQQKEEKMTLTNSNLNGISRFRNNFNDDGASLFSNVMGRSNFDKAGETQPKLSVSHLNLHKEKSIKRTNTAIELHKRKTITQNKNILLKEMKDLESRKEAIMEELATNSIQYEECINQLDVQIENKRNKVIEFEKS